MTKDQTLVWKDESGTYKIGYSQALQSNTLRELERGNILKLIIIIMMILLAAIGALIAFTGVMSQVMRQVVC